MDCIDEASFDKYWDSSRLGYTCWNLTANSAVLILGSLKQLSNVTYTGIVSVDPALD